MADRPNVLEASYWGVETTPGTPVAPTKKLGSLGLVVGPNFTFKTVRPVGRKTPTAVIAGKEHTVIRLSAENNFFEDIVWLLSGSVADPAAVRIIPSTGLAYRWVYTPSGTNLDAHNTYTIEHGSSAGSERIAGVQINGLHFGWDRESCTVDGDAFGHALDTAAGLTGTPTDSDNQPITGNAVDVFLDPTSTALGTTKLLRAFTGDLTIPGHFGMIWPLDSALTSYAASVELAMPATFALRLGADDADANGIAKARVGDRSFIRCVLKGPQIEAGTPANYYLFQIDVCGEVSNIGNQADQDGVTAYDVTFTAIEDPTWAKSFEVTVINKLAAIG
jgi:hypothetical protein